MALTLITPAATLPVSLAAVKAHCGVEDTAHDVVLEALRKAACRHVERQLDRGLGLAVWRLTLDAFAPAIELAQGPVLTVDEVGYSDPAGAPQVADPALYALDLTSHPARVMLNADAVWPEVLDGVNAVWVEFTAGWDETTLPPDLALAVLRCCARQFDDRAAAWPEIEDLLWPNRRIRI
jgi:uncharacterized phiE125 gp8 family phage protein